jgi:hypothetical protein
MNIKVLSSERGITLLQGSKNVVIHSSCYGVVAEGTRETVHNEDWSYCKAVYNLTICDWCGYWDLKSIITRGIKKWEKSAWKMNDCEITYITAEDQQMHLNKTVDLILKDN